MCFLPDFWKCTNCRLAFILGWFRYSLEATPYWSATFLVCRQCGTAHAIGHSSTEAICKDGFFNLGGPLFDEDNPTASSDESRDVIRLYEPIDVSNWPGGSDLVTDNIAELTCAHCGGDSLTNRWEKSWPCPSCGSEIKSGHHR